MSAELILRTRQAEGVTQSGAAMRAQLPILAARGITRKPRIVYYGPTGFGKSIVFADMARKSAARGLRVCVMLDRVVLVNQTSAVFDYYRIPHAVIMSKSGRFHLAEKIHICSIHTLAAMNMMQYDVILIDECHVLHKSQIAICNANPTALIVGFTATPTTKSCGEFFDDIVCPATTNELVNEELLIMPSVYCAEEINMAGVSVKSGEWDKNESGKRTIKIVGNIVGDYLEKTHEHFGGPVKTVIAVPNVASGAELAQAFAAVGLNFIAISYRDDSDFKRDVFKDFSRDDTKINGLIAVDMLTKGFDCVLEGSLILTDRGLVEVDKLLSTDRLWDGIEFVNHGGIIYKGERNVITYSGLTATPDHKVYTKYGWLQFGKCARYGIEIVRTGDGAKPICESSNVVGLPLQKYAKKVRKFGKQCLQKLWGARNILSVRIAKGGCKLDSSKLGASGAKPLDTARQNRQQRQLRGGEFALGFAGIEQLEQPKGWLGGVYAQTKAAASRAEVFRQNLSQLAKRWLDVCSDSRAVSPEIRQTKGRVWDILDAGPRNRFTCQGLLVHNCPGVKFGICARAWRKGFEQFVQFFGRIMRTCEGKKEAVFNDHGGNFFRFGERLDDQFLNGCTTLNKGAQPKAPKEKTPAEKAECFCPKCRTLWVGNSDTCSKSSCGYVRPPRKSGVETVAGKMKKRESKVIEAVSKQQKQDFYSQLLHIETTRKYKPTFALAAFREKFGAWPNGCEKITAEPQTEVLNWVKSRLIKAAKRAQKKAAA